MNYKLFVITVLASVGFFNYHGLVNDQIAKALFYLAVLVSFVQYLRDGVSLKGTQYPRIAYFGMMVGFGVSIVMASALHSQSLMMSVMTTLPFIFSFGYFYVLMRSGIPKEKIMNTYLVLCAIATVVYFMNVATMPHNIFGVPILSIDETRGIIRIPVVFIEFFPMIVFYAINKWLIERKKKWLVVIGWASLMIFLAVIRQIIALTAVLGLWFVFRRISTWKKVALIVASLAVVVFVLPQIPIYKTMIELSEDQSEDNESGDDIRVNAWRYYTYEHQTNSLTPILGNGVPSFGNSLWGKIMDSDTEVNRAFAADVGWAGFFWYFGAITTACLLILLAKAYLKPKDPSEQYLNYWLIFVTITSVASGPVIYYWQIVDIVVCLYLVYKPKSKTSDKAAESDDKEDSHTDPKLQQRARYPQLHQVDTAAQ